MSRKKLTFKVGCFDGKSDVETDDLNKMDNLKEGNYDVKIFSKESSEHYGALVGVDKKLVVGVIRPLLERDYSECWAVIEPRIKV